MLQVLETLGSESMRPSTAAQCVAYLACAELPNGLWPDVIEKLTSNVTNPASTEMMKESSLETIGYICQDIVSRLIICWFKHILFRYKVHKKGSDVA